MKIDKNKMKWYIGLLSICLVVIALGVSTKINWSASKIFKTTNNSHLHIVTMDDSVKGDYKSQVYFKDDVLKKQAYAGCIEVFRNPKEAILRKSYLEMYDKALSQKITIEDFGPTYIDQVAVTKETYAINKQVLFRFNGAYTEYQKKQLLKDFNKTLKKEWQIQTSFISEEEMKKKKESLQKKAIEDAEAYYQAIVKKIEKEINQIEKELIVDDVDSVLDTIDKIKPYLTIPIVYDQALAVSDLASKQLQNSIDTIDNLLNKAATEYDETYLTQAKGAMDSLKHPYFDDYKSAWLTRISQIEWDIKAYQKQLYKDQCNAYEYDTIMSEVDAYVGTHAFFRGNVVEVVGSSLRVNVTPVYSFFTDKILYWEDSILVEIKDAEAALIEKGQLVSMWGEIEGLSTMENLFGSQKALSFHAKYIE